MSNFFDFLGITTEEKFAGLVKFDLLHVKVKLFTVALFAFPTCRKKIMIF